MPDRRRHPWPLAVLAVAAAAAAAAPALAGADGRSLSQCIRERWTYRDGLPHDVAHRLLAARSGYLWIGTQEGLVRFDGVRFKTFAHLDTPGLAGNEIDALLEDARGVLWIGTSIGLTRMEGDVFEEVRLGGDLAVSALAEDGEGGVWVATEAQGVYRVHAGPGARVERLEGLAEQRVMALAREGAALWIGGPGGLTRLAGGRLEAVDAPGLPGEPVSSLVLGRDGALWVGTSVGLARRRPGAAGFEPVALPGGRIVDALLEDAEGAIWVGVRSGPVVRIRDGRAEALGGTGSPVDAHALAVDGGGDVWAGTESSGLYRLRWGQAVTLAREEGLSADVIWAVREGRGGVMWVAGDGGLDKLEGERVARAHASELAGTNPISLLEDRAGDLWVGTDGAGLVRFGARGVRRHGDESGLAHAMVRILHEDQRGAIWAGTRQGLYRQQGDRFVPLARDPRLAGETVNALAELPDGSLWVGTTTGLARVEGDRLVPAEPGGQRIRSDVTALRAEPDGTLWVGTVGEGLLRLAGGRLQRWTQRQGMFEDTVLAILDDGAGHLWLSGNHGISRLSRAELDEVAAGRRPALAPLAFGVADGMRERECNGGVGPPAWRGADGRLWFATIRGVVWIDPARLAASPPPPPARVEELSVDGHPRRPGGALRLPPGTHRVDVRYTGLSLAGADRLRFRYRLRGLDEAYLDAGGERAAHFTNLGPGRYVFEVSAGGAPGRWGQPAQVAFEIEPHLWQARWFSLAAALAVAALALALHWARVGALRRSEARLAARVEEEMRRVKILSGLLPTCAWCKRIKDDAGDWHQFEAFVSKRTDAQFSHGMCPECYARFSGGEDEGR